MPVQIELVERFDLVVKEDGTLDLPVITLAPADSSQPYVYSVTVEVPALEGTAKTLTERIQGAYKPYLFDPPYRLQGRRPLRVDSVQLVQSLTEKVDCTLSVYVEYSEFNHPGSSRLSTTASCRLLYSAPESAPPPVLAEPVQPKFSGWLAVDLGTASSTVTLFDSRKSTLKQPLPPEQENRLREGFLDWLDAQPTDALPGVGESDWRNFIGRVTKSLPGSVQNAVAATEVDKLLNLFCNGSSAEWHAAICQMELQLKLASEPLRRAASQKFHAIYHEAFREPRLQSQHLFPVQLDLDEGEFAIPSVVEITCVAPLQVRMGAQVRKERLQAISVATGDQSWSAIQQRFHRSPKRHLLGAGSQERAQTTTVAANGEQCEISCDEELRAAWFHLIDLTNKYRKRFETQFEPKRFTHAVVTYPTVAPPAVRHKIRQLFAQILGNTDDVIIQTDYDEATSAAIFYLMRELGGTQDLGMEAFKARCRSYGGNKWQQNVLVLDIGGGTTDVALIHLAIEERDPFKPNEDRGLGGHFYEITPELRGASGHLQLGGELITLEMFRLFKVALADHLLTEAAEGRLQNQRLNVLMGEIHEDFSPNGQFKPGSLLACTGRPDAYRRALDEAERVIPTRWKDDPPRLQTFETLWELADDTKIELGKHAGRINVLGFKPDKIRSLLTNTGLQLSDEEFQHLNFFITREQFEAVIRPLVEEAIGIAQGLIKSRLHDGDEPVDWLILSGQTCNLYLINEVLREKFINFEHFKWNPENITFVRRYAKLATSIGACYAEKVREFGFDETGARDRIKRGLTEISLNIKNLLFYLPCDFWLKTQTVGAEEKLFSANEKLEQLDKQPVGKTRTNWRSLNLYNAVDRIDYENGPLRPWGLFRGSELTKKLSMLDEEWRKNIKGQFEINHRLEISLLLCRGDKPYYDMSNAGYSLNVGLALPVDAAGRRPNANASPLPSASTETAAATAAEDGDTLSWDIAVNAIAGNPDAEPDVIFKIDEIFTEVFHYPDGRTRRGLVRKLPEAPRNGYLFHGRRQSGDWQQLNEQSWQRDTAQFSQNYYATLDQDGELRLHAGVVPYWTSTDEWVLLREEGRVFRVELEPQGQDYDKARDPFCGEH